MPQCSIKAHWLRGRGVIHVHPVWTFIPQINRLCIRFFIPLGQGYALTIIGDPGLSISIKKNKTIKMLPGEINRTFILLSTFDAYMYVRIQLSDFQPLMPFWSASKNNRSDTGQTLQYILKTLL